MRRVAPHPLAVVATVSGALAIVATIDREADWLLIPATVAAFVVGRHARRWMGAALIAVMLGVLIALTLVYEPDSIVPYVMLPATLWLTGAALREHDLVANRLVAQADELEAERETYAALSVRYERARIAAELHDVVAHAISVMVVQAGAGQRLVDAAPEAAEETFRVIGDAARQAESDLGRLAELLVADADAGPGAGLGLVEDVVARAVASGLAVTLRLEGDRDGLRGPAAHAASRVVQEGLTNALRYAPGAAVRVLVRAAPGAVLVEVANGAVPDGARPLGLGSGLGLIGVRERVEAVGGRLEAGPHGAGWRLAARLPAGSVVPA